MGRRISWFAAGLGTATWVRRLSTRTGVTSAEAFASLPGGDVIEQPMLQWTLGVTVAASADAIWPWLVQAGHGRAGWYTTRWVDDLMEPILFAPRLSTVLPTIGSIRSCIGSPSGM